MGFGELGRAPCPLGVKFRRARLVRTDCDEVMLETVR